MNTSFTKKQLEAHITLAEGGFNTVTGQGANTKIIRLGMDVDIQKPGGKEKNKAKVRIFNLPLADMETLTTLAFKPLRRRRTGSRSMRATRSMGSRWPSPATS